MPEVIPNAIDMTLFTSLQADTRKNLRRELGFDSETPLVLSVLRLSNEKRPFDMLLTMQALLTRLPAVRFLHVGIGVLSEETRQLAEALGLNGKISFMGARHDVPALMAAADALLMTSHIESCPNVLLEAMVSGLPFVASRVGGIPELVENSGAGFIREQGDYEGMAEALSLLLNNVEHARSMGANGKRYVASRYTMDKVADNVLAAYERQFTALGYTR
jgi:glycosyltransferase involved in cell wall biosynthesis